MKAKLIKDSDGYWLDISDDGITKRPLTDFGQLSIKNCEAIANGYDLDELAEKHYDVHIKRGHTEEDSLQRKIDFTIGFVSALEILGDKKFSEEDVATAYDKGQILNIKGGQQSGKKYVKSLQPNEWDVEILMESKDIDELRVDKGSFLKPNDIYKPKLDSDNCLILKRI